MQSLTLPTASPVPKKSRAVDADSGLTIPVSRYLIFFGIAVAGCLADLLSKHWVFEWLGPPRPGNEWWIWEGYVGFETATNNGAVFGAFAGWVSMLAGLSVIAALGVIYWLFWAGAARDLLLTITLGCIMGGIFGNLYDRLGLWHCSWTPDGTLHEVRDWILLRYGEYTWPNFNIADSLLVCGAGMLIIHAFRYEEPTDEQEESLPAEAGKNT